jgi:hypothetical protein
MLTRLLSLLLFAALVGCGGGDYAARTPMTESAAAGPAPAPPADMDGSVSGSAGEASNAVSKDESRAEPLVAGKMDMRLAQASPPSPPSGAAGPAKGKPGQTATVASGPALSPMLIYTATITLAVFEVGKSLGQVEEIGRTLGGFLAKRDDTTITIRVPSAGFDEAVRRIEGVGDMVHRNVSAEDVTEEFMDLEVRLKNGRAMRERLEQLLAKAQKVEESIAIERELGRVAGEIERLEGRMKFLRDRAAYSTITVTFQPRRVESLGAARPQLPVLWLQDLGLGRLLNL